ncbi:glycine zipper 2TM domain-containing protein [Piscinibacter koreensis]|uniref:Glycine zipper 2TM domain-containing protein n=1 Tax=Piscinibacter koreensis TaxID=2742824 RepID=A0A7Y6TX48_9BURK|nr:glycine zipper 2TM domain-containing protein [Schlegelella koreensis]NUZ06695.1 glycine zipper 2TM domain-containing protein [Schlegelella koreensis]
MKKSISVILLSAALAACSTTSPDVIQAHDAQRMARVVDATVLSVRQVVVQGRETGAGTIAGGVVGGVAGSSIGGHRDGIVGGVLGAVAGAVLGNTIERSVNREDAVEILVQLRNGERRAVVQARNGDSWIPGDPVVLVTSNGRTRVSHAPGYAPVARPVPPS